MIVNQLNKENSKCSRTVDLETGVYLEVTGADLRDHIYSVRVVDQNTNLYISMDLETRLNENLKEKYVNYCIQKVRIEGSPKRSGYLELIESLIKVHGERFKYSERRFGNREIVRMTVGPDVKKKISQWEKGNG